jgi:hypothetical protein
MLKLENIRENSGQKIHWICPNTCEFGCLHEWETAVHNRTPNKKTGKDGSGCPYCSNPPKKICDHNSLAYKHKDLAEQWHNEKNGNKTPAQFASKSNTKVWWLCREKCPSGCLHEWEETISNRTGGDHGCPFCSHRQCCEHISITATHPEILEMWDYSKNEGLDPKKFTAGSSQQVNWLCRNTCSYGCKHEWSGYISNIVGHMRGCPFCSKPQKKNCIHTSIVYTHPKLLEIWDYNKNGDIKPENYTFGSGFEVAWVCSKKHKYTGTINGRFKRGCPICINKTESKLYDYLIKLYPSLKKQLKLESCKNKTYLPFDFCVPELKVIIELDGRQHFKQISNWEAPDKIIKRDI